MNVRSNFICNDPKLKQSKCPSTENGIDRLLFWHYVLFYTMEYCSAMQSVIDVTVGANFQITLWKIWEKIILRDYIDLKLQEITKANLYFQGIVRIGKGNRAQGDMGAQGNLGVIDIYTVISWCP